MTAPVCMGRTLKTTAINAIELTADLGLLAAAVIATSATAATAAASAGGSGSVAGIPFAISTAVVAARAGWNREVCCTGAGARCLIASC